MQVESSTKCVFGNFIIGNCPLLSTSIVFAASFQGIGMPSVNGTPIPRGISSNYILVGDGAASWIYAGGMYTSPNLSTPISAISDDGSVIIGWSEHSFYKGVGNMVETIPGINGYLYTTATGISANGSTIVGNTRSPQMLGWVYENGSYSMLPMPSGYTDTASLRISRDGSIIAGSVWGSTGGGHIALWENGNVNVLSNPAGIASTWLSAISGDGSTIVGRYYYDTSHNGQAYVWHNGTIELLPMLTGITSAEATGVSYDGSLIFGNGGNVAFAWDQAHGTRSLIDFLQNDYGLNLTGWTLQSVSATDASGNIITGYGIDPQGQGELWIATIPEPATLVLLGLGGIFLRGRKTGYSNRV